MVFSGFRVIGFCPFENRTLGKLLQYGAFLAPTPKTRTPLSYDSYSTGSSSSGVGCPDPLTSLQSGSEILAEEWCWERCYSHPLNPLKTESEKAPNEGMCGIEVGGTLNPEP